MSDDTFQENSENYDKLRALEKQQDLPGAKADAADEELFNQFIHTGSARDSADAYTREQNIGRNVGRHNDGAQQSAGVAVIQNPATSAERPSDRPADSKVNLFTTTDASEQASVVRAESGFDGLVSGPETAGAPPVQGHGSAAIEAEPGDAHAPAAARGAVSERADGEAAESVGDTDPPTMIDGVDLATVEAAHAAAPTIDPEPVVVDTGVPPDPGVDTRTEPAPKVVGGASDPAPGGASIDEEPADDIAPSAITLESGGAVDETAEAGTVVATLATTDADSTDGFSYELVDASGAPVDDPNFAIDGNAIVVKAGASLDHESADSHELNVRVTDGGGNTYTQPVNISVADLDDESPTAVTIETGGAVDETAGTGTVVATLATTDADSTDGFSYELVDASGAPVDDPNFAIDGNAIVVKAGASLDHESADSHELNVRVTDGAGNSFAESLTITVNDILEVEPPNVIMGTNSTETLTGTDGADEIHGLRGHDTLDAGDGDDVIIGGAHNDRMDGGEGSDTFEVGANDGWDTFADSGTDGTDRVVATEDNVNIGINRTFNADSGIEVISADGHDGVNIVGTSSSDKLDFSGVELDGINTIDGGRGHDRITGSEADDVIIGGAHNDRMDGGEGSDTFEVGANDGWDTFADSGTDGTDRVVATEDNVNIGINRTFNADSGIEVISADGHDGVNIVGTSSSDKLDFSGVELDGINTIDGGRGHDRITGSEADDVIIGGAHNDRMDGGEGSDTFEVGANDGWDTFADSGTDGTDRVVATEDNVNIGINRTFNADSGIEVISADGHDGVNIVGTSSSDKLDFSGVELDGINTIDGGRGHDRITGGEADDVIIGGDHNDRMDGGEGSDTFEVGANDGWDTFADSGTDGTDRVVATEDNVNIGINRTFNADSGIEVISADGHDGVNIVGTSSSDKLDFSGVELDGINTIDGGRGHDRITGSEADDVIIGGAHNDRMDGGEGSDTFEVGANDGWDTFADSGTDGTDRVVATEDNVNIGINRTFNADSGIEVISADGHDGVNIVGTSSSDKLDFSGVELDGINTIDGGRGHDRITGSEADDVIIGGDHNDVLNGGAGDDVLIGGSGNDTLAGGDGDDLFIFGNGAGSDHVDGGAGWADVLQLENTPGADGADIPWTLEVDGEQVNIDLADKALELDPDSAGVVMFEDGSSVSFEGLEGLEW